MIRAFPFLVAFWACLLTYAALDLPRRVMVRFGHQSARYRQSDRLRRQVQGLAVHEKGMRNVG